MKTEEEDNFNKQLGEGCKIVFIEALAIMVALLSIFLIYKTCN